MLIKRFEIYLVNIDPAIGSEIKKMRRCLVISPDEMNSHIATVIIAPMTTKGYPYPSRVNCQFQGKDGLIVLDQIRTADKIRLIKKLGQIDVETQKTVLAVLGEMFAN